eukprot:scaffold16853_cov104-Isochrysis_galbana.AAC.5
MGRSRPAGFSGRRWRAGAQAGTQGYSARCVAGRLWGVLCPRALCPRAGRNWDEAVHPHAPGLERRRDSREPHRQPDGVNGGAGGGPRAPAQRVRVSGGPRRESQ